MDNGFFGNLFDLNRDGKFDSLEKAMDFITFEEIFSENEDFHEEE